MVGDVLAPLRLPKRSGRCTSTRAGAQALGQVHMHFGRCTSAQAGAQALRQTGWANWLGKLCAGPRVCATLLEQFAQTVCLANMPDQFSRAVCPSCLPDQSAQPVCPTSLPDQFVRPICSSARATAQALGQLLKHSGNCPSARATA